jgi:2-iminobutanoate/2-iminopropanoate deaminase
MIQSDSRNRVKKEAVKNPAVLNEAYDYPRQVSFSRGMRVELDGQVMLFISGTASIDENGKSIHKGDVAAQTRRVFTNIASLLESEGADWKDVVRTTCYLVDFDHYDGFNDARTEFYEKQRLDPLPASTCIQATLCRPELLVEIEAIAMIPKDRPR